MIGCKKCDGTGWVHDLTWCGDEDHCPPLLACLVCNPEGRDE